MTDLINEPIEQQFYDPSPDDWTRESWVFVSHSADDYNIVRRIMRRFDGPPRFLTLHIANRAQSDAFINAYRPRIMRSLHRCGWFVVFVSDASIKSKWVKFEVDWALRNRSTGRIICIMLDKNHGSVLHSGLVAAECINMRPLSENGNLVRKWISLKRLEWALPKGTSNAWQTGTPWGR